MLSLLSPGISVEGGQCGHRREKQNWENKLEGICLWDNGTLHAKSHQFPVSLQFIETDSYQLCSAVSGEKERIYLIQKILWRSESVFLSSGVFSASRGGRFGFLNTKRQPNKVLSLCRYERDEGKS